MNVRCRRSRRGFTLAETIVSAVLIGTLLVAAMRTFSSSLHSQRLMSERAKAAWLADALIGEIHPQSYMEPGASSSAVMREDGESPNSRAAYDDVDDYHGWTDSPPQNKDGTTIPNLAGWQRSVTVEWVTLADLGVVADTETGVKKVTVTVRLNGATVLSRVIVRTLGS